MAIGSNLIRKELGGLERSAVNAGRSNGERAAERAFDIRPNRDVMLISPAAREVAAAQMATRNAQQMASGALAELQQLGKQWEAEKLPFRKAMVADRMKDTWVSSLVDIRKSVDTEAMAAERKLQTLDTPAYEALKSGDPSIYSDKLSHGENQVLRIREFVTDHFHRTHSMWQDVKKGNFARLFNALSYIKNM